MPPPQGEIITATIIVTTFLLLLFGVVITRYIFLYQRKRYQHEQEVVELREGFVQVLLQSKLEIQEQTLDHISKELHANFSHLVSLININMSAILPNCTPEGKESILETKSLAKQLLSELRALSASLNTDHIIHIGFEGALKNELDRVGKAKKQQISVLVTGEKYRLVPEKEIILFRLTQEVLNNVIKYAKAKTITASLEYGATLFKLNIVDDGVGFDMRHVDDLAMKNRSTGMVNMRKRAKLMDAEFTISSTVGKGTKVEILIPIKTHFNIDNYQWSKQN